MVTWSLSAKYSKEAGAPASIFLKPKDMDKCFCLFQQGIQILGISPIKSEYAVVEFFYSQLERGFAGIMLVYLNPIG